jgi:hypothetical protein
MSRLIHICVTPAGRQLTAATPFLLQNTLVNALVELPDSEQIAMTMAMEKLVDLMEAGHIQADPVLETGPGNHRNVHRGLCGA